MAGARVLRDRTLAPRERDQVIWLDDRPRAGTVNYRFGEWLDVQLPHGSAISVHVEELVAVNPTSQQRDAVSALWLIGERECVIAAANDAAFVAMWAVLEPDEDEIFGGI